MLYLTRKIGETIIINDDIEITVVDVRGKSIKLGLTFPSDVSVYRQEIYDRIQAEKAADITLIDVRAVGAFGRLTLSGREADVEEAAAAAIKAIERPSSI